MTSLVYFKKVTLDAKTKPQVYSPAMPCPFQKIQDSKPNSGGNSSSGNAAPDLEAMIPDQGLGRLHAN